MSSVALFLFTIAVANVKAKPTVVSVFPTSSTVPEIGVSFVINISIQDVIDLYFWELKFYYPNDILNGTGVEEGPFLKSGGKSTLFWVHEFKDSYDETRGCVWVSCTRTRPTIDGVDGDGVLVSITFNSTSLDGPSVLHLADVVLGNSETTQIRCTLSDGEVTVVPEFPFALFLPLYMVLTITVVLWARKRKEALRNDGNRRKEEKYLKTKLLATIAVMMLLIGAFAVAFNFTHTATADTMYYLEVKTDPEEVPVDINGTGWYPDTSTADLEAPIIVNDTDCRRYIFDYWDVDGTPWTGDGTPWKIQVDMDQNHTATAHYKAQYKLTVITGHESLGVLPYIAPLPFVSWTQTSWMWINASTEAYAGIGGLDGSDGVYIDPPVNEQWAKFVNFTFPGKNPSGVIDYYTDPINMTNCFTVLANWKLMYKLYVKTVNAHPSIPGEGWYWKGTIVNLCAPDPFGYSPPYPAGDGWRWAFDKWEVVPDVENVYYGTCVNVTMNTNKTATAYYKAEYHLYVWDWPLNQTSLFDDYTGWYGNCTHVTMTADDTIPAGAGIRYKFYGWWRKGLGYFSTSRTITIHINYTAGLLPIYLEACYKLQYELTAKTDPTGIATIPGQGWYDAGTMNVPLCVPDTIMIDSGSRYVFDEWVKDPGGYTDSDNCTTIDMTGPRNATAFYTLEHKLIWDDDQGSSWGGEYWFANGTTRHTTWWPGPAPTDLGSYIPSMPTMVFHHWEIIQDGVSTHWDEGDDDYVVIDGPTTWIAHYLNETWVILSGGSDVAVTAPGVLGDTFDVDVIFANFNAERTVGGKPMDLYGAEFNITWDERMLKCTGYTPNLDEFWGTPSYIQADELGDGYFFFAAHAYNATEGFEGTRVMLTLHFEIIYESCYPYSYYTFIKMESGYKFANHNNERIYPEHHDWCKYSINAKRPKIAIESSVDSFFDIVEGDTDTFTVDVVAYNLVKAHDYYVEIYWDPTLIKAIEIIDCEEYFAPPYNVTYEFINNQWGYLEKGLELNIPEGAEKVYGNATLFTIIFEVIIDENYDAWWAPDHEAWKIDIRFDYAVISVQCAPLGPDVVYWELGYELIGEDADPWYTPYIGDLNYDGHIDLDDLMLIKLNYHGSTYDISWGQGSTGIVDIFDAVLVAINLWTGPRDP